jgi:hypothetical protein
VFVDMVWVRVLKMEASLDVMVDNDKLWVSIVLIALSR